MKAVTFEIISPSYKVSSSGLTKSMVIHAFTEKKLSSKGFCLRDSEGLDMTFGEFMMFYVD